MAGAVAAYPTSSGATHGKMNGAANSTSSARPAGMPARAVHSIGVGRALDGSTKRRNACVRYARRACMHRAARLRTDFTGAADPLLEVCAAVTVLAGSRLAAACCLRQIRTHTKPPHE